MWTLLRSKTLLIGLISTFALAAKGQNIASPPDQPKGYMVPVVVQDGVALPTIQMRTFYVFAPMVFANEKERANYARLIRDVKKTLPFAKIVAATLLETYAYMETLPNEKAKEKHLKRMEKEIYKQYYPEMRKLTLRQGKLLLRLIDRECGSSSYQLVDAFLGGFSARFWNLFAGLFGADLKSQYDPEGMDILTERVVIMVENGLV